MNTRLHDILDGDLSDRGGEELFQLPEEHHEFQEHKKLREEMRRNADAGGLTSADKSAMRAQLAAAIGVMPTVPTMTAPPETGAGIGAGVAAGTSARSGWYLKALAALILGVAIGAGLFAALDDRPNVVERTVGVPVQTVTPAAVPHGIPEPAPGATCDSLVDQLRDSLRLMKAQGKGNKATKKSQPPWWKRGPAPTTGGKVNP